MRKSLNKLPTNMIIEDIKISSKNKKLIEKYIETYKANLYYARKLKYRYSLTRFAYLIEKDFDKIESKEEVIKLNNIIHKSNLGVRTLQDFVSEVKNFYRDMYEDEKFTDWILMKLKAPTSKGKLRLPPAEEMPTEKLILRAVKACHNSRDKFFISLIGLDGAIRPIEARRIVWRDVKKDKYGFYITIKTAKGSGDKSTRTVRLIKSEPYFVQWNKDYPAEKKDDAPIFINFSDLKPMNQGSISALFRRLRKKLGLKHFYPYLLRHGLITSMSKDPKISIPVLKQFIGHSQRSNTIGEYIHLDDSATKNMQLEINGIVKTKEQRKLDRQPIKCPKCKKSNEWDAEFCHFCNMALSQKRVIEIDEILQKNNEVMFKQVAQMIEAKIK